MMVVSLQKLSKNRQRQCLEFSMFFICLPGLKFLVRLCTDLGLKDAQEYANKLKKAEKAKELREQVNILGFFFYVKGCCFEVHPRFLFIFVYSLSVSL